MGRKKDLSEDVKHVIMQRLAKGMKTINILQKLMEMIKLSKDV